MMIFGFLAGLLFYCATAFPLAVACGSVGVLYGMASR